MFVQYDGAVLSTPTAVSHQPILIVNADDLGWNRNCTDRTLEAFAARRITSATAMVHMADSDRAAGLALEAGVPMGLHLNLTDPFTDSSVGANRRTRQLKACKHFSAWRFRVRSWSYDPRIRSDIDATISDQLERFKELYGKSPTHVDGHNHVHTCPNVALSAALAPIDKMRDGLWAWPSARSPMGAARAVRRALTSARFLRTRYFLDIAQLHRDLGAPKRLASVSRASRTSVEVMCHPGFSHERQELMAPEWSRLLEACPLGSYGDLRRT